MKLSSRLSALARLIRAGKRMADIGTDHGYLPAYLLDQRICPFVYCCDVNPLPLKRAKQTFFALALTDGVSFVLSDGMTGLVSTDVEDVVIAGMGGDMIAHILEQGFSDGKVYEHIRFLLQPMSKAEKLRDYLGKNGFSRDEEVLVEDEGRVFLIFCCIQFRQPEYVLYMERPLPNFP
jgi:tRNA (adenine22-N1)-methyltransferase